MARLATISPLSWLSLVTVWLVWGSTYLGIRVAVETVPPMLMAGGRYLLAGALMLLVIGPRYAARHRRPTWRQLRSVVVAAALLLLGGNGLLSVGETELSSGLAALLVATVPAWMLLFDALLRRTRPRGAALVALALGIIGVGVLVGGPGTDVPVASAVTVLVGAVFWAAGSVYVRRATMPTNPFVLTSLEMVAGGILLLTVGLARGEGARFDPHEISGLSALGFGWLVFAGSLLAFTAYMHANATLPTELMATYAYVNPLVAVLLGVLLGQEPIGLNLLLGGAIVLGSVVLLATGARRDTKPAQPPGPDPAVEGSTRARKADVN